MFELINETNYTIHDSIIEMEALPQSDLICSCRTGNMLHNAPMLVKEMTGDFQIVAKMSHEFKSLFDATGPVIYENEKLWAKAAFECSNTDTYTAVSVMTNGLSDDCNHADVDTKEIWMRLNKMGNVISVQYSLDGENWIFMRICHIPFTSDTVKAGFIAQSPSGDGGTFIFKDYSIKNRTFKAIRKGE